MAVRLGEVMIEQGLLTRQQVETILQEQRKLHRPFGELAERLFGVSERDVERSWATQYGQIAERVDPREEIPDPEIIALVTRRQAWQFRLLPLRRDGSEIMIATVVEFLPRAMRFALRHFPEPAYFVVADLNHLGEALMRHFPIDGVTAEEVVLGRFGLEAID